MTDHAEEWRAEVHKLSASWDKISAERQQAIDKLWEQTEAAANLLTEVERLEAERQQAQEDAARWKDLYCGAEQTVDEAEREVDELRRQRQQAIDALRSAIDYLDGGELVSDELKARELRAVAVKLGEKP